MLGALDGGGFGWNEADNQLDEQNQQDQGRIAELTEEYGFDVALGMTAGALGPEAVAGLAAYDAGEYTAEKVEEYDVGSKVKDKAGDIYDGVSDKLEAFQDEYGSISLGMFDDKNEGVMV